VSFPPLGHQVKVLLVWPRFPPSFWGFLRECLTCSREPGRHAPAWGLITVAALCPPAWKIRLLDCACGRITPMKDLLWSDLVMVSRHARRSGVNALSVTGGAPATLGRRTFIGGSPGRAAIPTSCCRKADHVTGRGKRKRCCLRRIAAETGRKVARRSFLSRSLDKPDLTRKPGPPLRSAGKMDRYGNHAHPVFHAGCPFQCEFCDIHHHLTAAKPRTKTPRPGDHGNSDLLRTLGWRNDVFIVDDNFIGNSANSALQLARRSSPPGSKRHDHPFPFFTEGLDQSGPSARTCWPRWWKRTFMYVFIGIETPSSADAP